MKTARKDRSAGIERDCEKDGHTAEPVQRGSISEVEHSLVILTETDHFRAAHPLINARYQGTP